MDDIIPVIKTTCSFHKQMIKRKNSPQKGNKNLKFFRNSEGELIQCGYVASNGERSAWALTKERALEKLLGKQKSTIL